MYYNLLLFTKDQDIPLASIDTQSQNSQTLIENTETHNYTISDEDDLNQSVIDEATMNVNGQESVEKQTSKDTVTATNHTCTVPFTVAKLKIILEGMRSV
ncbi:hypothetical protein FQR65_LT11453 [Abscondita terminalis]|nr:hypothetical protein FQR65_LT11453 [Abscondita terminalis]